jgi:hypothetical protein
VCTVVLRWQPGGPQQILALRDELVGRAFDDPDAWWPAQRDVVGGRDRTAGGTWCACDVVTGTTALLVNRPQRRVAEPGAPSRGVLPLLLLERGDDWQGAVALEGMASFMLIRASPSKVTVWEYDGTALSRTDLDPGTHLLTSGGAEDGRERRHLGEFIAGEFPDDWLRAVQAEQPSADLASLVVRVEHEGNVYATVFGQLIESRPGRLDLRWSREPWLPAGWSSRTWTR